MMPLGSAAAHARRWDWGSKLTPRGNEPLTEDVLAGFIAHPDFIAAGRCVAAGTVQLFFDHPTMRHFDKDRGTTLVVLFAACLSVSEDGLTMTRLKALCRKSNACSLGRAIRIVNHLRARGDIIPAEPDSTVRPRRLILGSAMRRYQEDWLKLHLDALRKFTPHERGTASSDDGAHQFPALMQTLGTILENSADLVTEDTVVLNRFADRDAGMLILLDLVHEHAHALHSAPVKISVQGLSRRFGVSRIHILDLLRDVHRAGLATWSADTRELVLSPQLVHSLKRYFAAMLMIIAYCRSVAETSTPPSASMVQKATVAR
jgi:hypothetical protein